jgi:exodeoxyribonuclease VII large subunit
VQVVAGVSNCNYFKNPLNAIIGTKEETVDNLSDKLLLRFNDIFNKTKTRLTADISKLDALSPLKVLSRGFSVAEHNGKVLSSVNKVEVGDSISLKLTDGSLNCTVNSKGE